MEMSPRLEQMLREVLVGCGTTVDGERVDVRGCDLSAFNVEGKIVLMDSFWKIRET
jgi:hypothetical protein